jgi:PAS domain S-box-containing protein
MYVSKNVSQFGYTAEEFLDGNILFTEIIHPEDLQRVGGEVQHYSESKVDHFKQQYRIIDKKGKDYWIDDWTIICRDEEDNISHYLGIIVDITDRKRSEEALRKANQEIEEANRQLKQAMELANQMAMKAKLADQAKGEFLANMSHEIRTSMNGITGMTDLLLDTELTPEQRDFAELIKKSADSLLDILNGILDFSKIEAGKLELDIQDFDLLMTLEDVNDIMALRAHEKGVELVCLMEPEVPLLLQGDAGRLRQILSNLIDNAVKFTRQGEVALHVSLDAEEENEGVILRFTIKDTGIGISNDKIDQLFVAFAQADGSTTRKFGGTGLGLAISKQLVEMMGGKIGVESEVDKGSTFSFTVRLQKQPDQERRERIQEVDESLLEKRILLVDDNEMNRQALSNMLTSWKCRHDTAPDAEKALEKLHKAARTGDPFHIAVVDMFMPDTDGESLGKTINADPQLQDITLVMLNLIGERWDVSQLKKAGFAAFLTKPVKQTQLYDCLMTVISRR